MGLAMTRKIRISPLEASIAVSRTLFVLTFSTTMPGHSLVFNTTRKLPVVRMIIRDCFGPDTASLSFKRKLPRPRSTQEDLTLSKAKSLQLICRIFISSSSPVTTATSSYFLLTALDSSYSLAASLRDLLGRSADPSPPLSLFFSICSLFSTEVNRFSDVPLLPTTVLELDAPLFTVSGVSLFSVVDSAASETFSCKF